MQRPIDCGAGVHDRDTCEADTTGSTVAGAREVCEANTAGTDDGFLGTGRADQAVTYRNTLQRAPDRRTAAIPDGRGHGGTARLRRRRGHTQGEEGIDVLAIGVQYGFSFKLFHRR
jgi:hypothetical protein